MKQTAALLCAIGCLVMPCVSKAEAPPAPTPSEQWRSELFSDLASAQLNELGALLKSDQVDELANSGLFEASPDVGRLLPKELEVVTDTESLRVRRLPEGSSVEKGGLSFEALEEVRGAFSGEKLTRGKFKLFNVDFATPDAPLTRQYVNLGGPVDEGFLDQNSTWIIRWAWPEGSEEPPTIAAVELEVFEEVLVKSSDKGTVFREATQAVLGGSTAFEEQLLYGNTHWRQRIELSNRFYKFGHQGIAVGDVNGDGRDDLYVCQNGGLPNRLLIQQADGTAKDMAAEYGVDLLDLTRSALFVDLDNDGDQDLVIATDTGLLAFRNNGRGRLEAKLRYPTVRNAFGIAAADYNNDGYLDLYVCRYFANKDEGAGLAIPVPYFNANNGGGNFLIRNDGPADNEDDWLKFSDATVESGLEEQNNRRFSFAAVWEDIDNDGDQDLFVANDFGLKNLYINEGGKFRDIAIEAGIDDGGFGMSASSSDYDGDGVPDLYAGNMFSGAGSRVTRQPEFRPGLDPEILARFQRMARGNSLFRGMGNAREGDPAFADVSLTAGVTVGRWSWGSIFGDLNNDGWEDIVVANGFVTGAVPDDL